MASFGSLTCLRIAIKLDSRGIQSVTSVVKVVCDGSRVVHSATESSTVVLDSRPLVSASASDLVNEESSSPASGASNTFKIVLVTTTIPKVPLSTSFIMFRASKLHNEKDNFLLHRQSLAASAVPVPSPRTSSETGSNRRASSLSNGRRVTPALHQSAACERYGSLELSPDTHDLPSAR